MKITNILYHRNGSGCCEGFTQVFFSEGRKLKNMMAILFEDTSKMGLINLDDPTAKFDADYYRPTLESALKTYWVTFDHTVGAYTQKFPFEVK